MSEEKKPAAKSGKDSKPGKPSRLQKVLQWFTTLPQRIAKPFRNMYYELKKVTWPSKQKLISYSIIVLLFMLAMGIVVGLLDMGASAGVRSLVNSRSSVTSTVEEEETSEEEAEASEEEAEATEETAAESTEAPEAGETEAPETETEAPAEETEAPAEETEAPAEPTEEN